MTPKIVALGKGKVLIEHPGHSAFEMAPTKFFFSVSKNPVRCFYKVFFAEFRNETGNIYDTLKILRSVFKPKE